MSKGANKEQESLLDRAISAKKVIINPVNKPPLGIKPKCVLEEERKIEILGGMIRYVNHNTNIPNSWIRELIELNNKVSIIIDPSELIKGK